MVAFIDVLHEVEALAAEANRPFAAPQLGLTEVVCAQATVTAATGKAESAYRSFQGEPPPEQCAELRQELPSKGRLRFAQLLSEARHSPAALRALRRRLAWRLHPDRGLCNDAGFPLSLSEVNAQIDAALTSGLPDGPARRRAQP